MKIFVMTNMKLSAFSVVLLVSSSWISSGVVVRHYNEINRKVVDTLEAFQDEYMTNHPDIVTTMVTSGNIMLGVSEPQVKRQMVIFYRFPSTVPTVLLFLTSAAFLFPV